MRPDIQTPHNKVWPHGPGAPDRLRPLVHGRPVDRISSFFNVVCFVHGSTSTLPVARSQLMVVLPEFRYHGSPLALGIIEESACNCSCCGEARGYAYSGSLYDVDDDTLVICPWCIADGLAHSKFGVTFNHAHHLPDSATLADSVTHELFQRTPGFRSWQEREWICHCNDACRFMGDVSVDEAQSPDWDAVQRLMESYGQSNVDREVWSEMIQNYEPGNPSLFKFVCTQCGLVFYQIDTA